MSDASPAPRLSLFDATCVVVGAIIGVGIFFGPGDVARLAGGPGPAMLAWTIGGFIALLGALTLAELGRLVPHTGGQYEVLRRAFGSVPAFLFVTCNITAIQGGAVAIIGLICAQNIGLAVTGAAPTGPPLLGLSVVLIVALASINALGVKPGAIVQDSTVILKVAALAAIALLAALIEPSAPAAAATDAAEMVSVAGLSLPTLFAAVTITLFSYGGWQQALWIAGEVKDARRNVPRAIVIGVVIVVIVYLAANWAYFDLLGFAGVRDAKALAAEAVGAAVPSIGARVIAGAVAISAFGVLNAQFLTGPWLTQAMARDGLFFAPFARRHPRFGTPHAAIALLTVLGVGLLFLGQSRTDLLTTGVVVIDALFFALTGFALIRLRRLASAADRSPAWLVPVAVTFGTLELAAVAGSLLTQNVRMVALSGLGWIAATLLLYVVAFRSRSVEA